jgi:hypothetical protein
MYWVCLVGLPFPVKSAVVKRVSWASLSSVAYDFELASWVKGGLGKYPPCSCPAPKLPSVVRLVA